MKELKHGLEKYFQAYDSLLHVHVDVFCIKIGTAQ